MVNHSKARMLNGRYALLPGFKSGGMADIYEATDLQNGGQQVAVKLLKQGKSEAGFIAEAFQREVWALKELKHPSIVQLLHHGIDEETKRDFIVMEWIDYDLEEWLGNNPLGGWDDFYEKIGQPILKALDLAHNRHLIHRDLKPKNILMLDGLPKLADFGISKLIKFSDSSVTLADFHSRPYTPKEFDDGTATFSRDVYSFGVIVLRCLTNVELKSYEDLGRALDELDVPDEIYGIMERCLADDVQRRPKNAPILFNELDKVWRNRAQHFVTKEFCYLSLTRSVLDRFPSDQIKLSQAEIEKKIREDLSQAHAIEDFVHNQQPVENQYRLIGTGYSYQITLDDRNKDHFKIVNVWSNRPSEIERIREKAYQALGYVFKISQPNPAEISRNRSIVMGLQDEISQFHAEKRQRESEEQEEQLFRIWGRILGAKNAFEKEKHKPLRYDRFSPANDGRIRFSLRDALVDEAEELEGQWLVRNDDKPVVKGEIEGIEDNTLTLQVTFSSGSAEQLPRKGQIEFDNGAAEQALGRQRKALDSVRFCKSVRSDLKAIINDPNKSKLSDSWSEIEFTQELDSSKKEAVRAALNAEDFLVVEGPPGTGKTTFITELILQELKRRPQARILLSSQTHVALDNVVERLAKRDPQLKMVRLANRDNEKKVAPTVNPYLLDPQKEDWRKEAIASGKQYLEDWAKGNGISAHNVEVGRTIEGLANIRTEIVALEKKQELRSEERDQLKQDQQTTSQEELDQLSEDLDEVKEKLKECRKRRKELEAQLVKLEKDIGADLLEQSAEDLRGWIRDYLPDTPENKKYLELQSIYTDWQNRFGRTPAFNAALLTSCQVVAGTCLGIMGLRGIEELEYDLCIVDEASKATPTETLIPLSRSRRWVLVGDQKQLSPFQDAEFRDSKTLEKYDLTRNELKSTLFGHLADYLPAECRSSLSIQHRMVPPIGNLISHCFYDGELKSAEKELDKTLLASYLFKHPVTWFTTEHLPYKAESHSFSSFVNRCEVEIAKKLIEKINWLAQKANKQYSLALLVGYTGQKREMERSLNAERRNWSQIDLDIQTVDAFQGQEADIALYSVTRTNPEGKIGFLREAERINVALSRGRYYLGIIGDHRFCYSVEGDNPFRKVVEYIEQHPQECAISKEYQ